MNKPDLIDAILEETDKYDREDLEDSSQFTNSDRKEILSGLLEDEGGSDEDHHVPSGQEIAEENGYPEVNGQFVIDIIGRRTDEPAVHCRLQDGSSTYVHSDKFE